MRCRHTGSVAVPGTPLARFITLAARARNESMGFCESLKGVWQGPSRLDKLEISSTAKLPTKD